MYSDYCINANPFPWYIHLMIYMPLIVYVPFFGIGYAMEEAIYNCDTNDNFDQV